MNKIALALLLFFITGTANALVKEGHAEITGYKKSGENAHRVIYRVHTPHMPLHNAWLRVDLKTAVFGYKQKRIADPEQAALEFKSDEWEKTAAWEPAIPHVFPIVREAQITIQDGISCNL
jgi:hypothetical protein